jgi:hypothetical protein
MPWWFKSSLIILTGMLLLLLGDFAARASGGFRDATSLRLVGASLLGLGVFLGLSAATAGTRVTPSRRTRKR